MSTYSQEHVKYLKQIKRKKCQILFTQFIILLLFFITWELLSKSKIINSFLFSSPSNIITTIINLLKSNDLFNHIFITIYEIFLSSLLSLIIGFIISTFLWWNSFFRKVFEPFLTNLNSLPKVALGPLIIIWFGASINSIIVMSLTISLFITIINLFNYFIQTDKNYIILLKSMKAKKYDIYKKVIIKANIKNIINTIKINISMSFIGVIMGELLVSKQGLGYLIMYGSNVFNINLVITSIFILGILSSIFYYIIELIEKKIK